MRALSPTTSALRLVAFAVLALAVLVTIVATIHPLGSPVARTAYSAEFTSASDLKPGDDVRVAGVKVGTVASVSLTSDGLARVGFDVDRTLPVSTSTTLEIRYLDLAGNRYLAVLPGRPGAPAQPAATTIGDGRTTPALDINDLLAGFRPLLQGLSPKDVNDLSLEIVQTLQGDGPTIRHLIARTASLTGGLAQRDQLIGAVIANLDAAVGTLAGKHVELERLITGLRVFADGLSADRRSIGQAIAHIDTMTAVTSSLLAQARPPLAGDIRHLGSVAATLASPFGHAQIDHAMNHLPDKLARLTATASYGSWFNYYVCGVRVVVSAGAARLDAQLASLLEKIHLVDTAKRCS